MSEPDGAAASTPYSEAPFDERFLKSLGRRDVRDRAGLCLVESLQCVLHALRSHHRVVLLIVARGLAPEPQTARLLASRQAAGVPVLRLSPREIRRISRLDGQHGIAAVVEQRWSDLARPKPGDAPVWLAFETVLSPGNLGTVFRSAAATGVTGHLFLGPTGDPFHPVTVRASMGALFSQRLVRTTAGTVRAWKRRTGSLVVGASPEGRFDYREVNYRGPMLLMVGEERAGLSRAQKRLCDRLVRIPMCAGVDSLNLGVATTVLLYEVLGQRHPLRRR